MRHLTAIVLLTLALSASCEPPNTEIVEALAGSWEIVEASAAGENTQPLDLGLMAGVLTLPFCDDARSFNPCPGSFTTPDGSVYPVTWTATFDLDGAKDFTAELSGDYGNHRLAVLLDRDWSFLLSIEEMILTLNNDRQTDEVFAFEELVEAEIILRKR